MLAGKARGALERHERLLRRALEVVQDSGARFDVHRSTARQVGGAAAGLVEEHPGSCQVALEEREAAAGLRHGGRGRRRGDAPQGLHRVVGRLRRVGEIAVREVGVRQDRVAHRDLGGHGLLAGFLDEGPDPGEQLGVAAERPARVDEDAQQRERDLDPPGRRQPVHEAEPPLDDLLRLGDGEEAHRARARRDGGVRRQIRVVPERGVAGDLSGEGLPRVGQGGQGARDRAVQQLPPRLRDRPVRGFPEEVVREVPRRLAARTHDPVALQARERREQLGGPDAAHVRQQVGPEAAAERGRPGEDLARGS